MEKQFWYKYFKKTILERGYKYFETGYVERFEYRDDFKSAYAVVGGGDEYKVRIKFNNDLTDIESMECACPHADDGNNCKHMAAVLFAFDEQQINIRRNTKSDFEMMKDFTSSGSANYDAKEIKQIKAAIDDIPIDKLRNLVLNFAQNDTHFGDGLLISRTKKITPKMRKRLKATLNEIILNYEYDCRNFFIGYDPFEMLIDNLKYFIELYSGLLVSLRMYYEAFEIVFDTYTAYIEADSADYDDIHIFCDYFSNIIEKADDGVKHKIFETFISQPYLIYILGNVSELFCGKEYSRRLIDIVDRLIENDSEESDDILVFLVRQRCELMSRLDISGDEIHDYRRKFIHLKQFAEDEFNRLAESDQTDEALKWAFEQYESVKSNRSQRNSWFERIKSLCQDRGLNEAYANVLMKRIENEYQHDLKLVNELKSITSATDWLTLRLELSDMDTMRIVRFEFLREEELYDKLFDSVVTSSNTQIIWDNEKFLKKKYPYEMRDLLAKVLDVEMENAGNRDMYRQALNHLEKIKSYPDGNKMAESIVFGWCARYQRRRAMIEEIKKQGYSTNIWEVEQD